MGRLLLLLCSWWRVPFGNSATEKINHRESQNLCFILHALLGEPVLASQSEPVLWPIKCIRISPQILLYSVGKVSRLRVLCEQGERLDNNCLHSEADWIELLHGECRVVIVFHRWQQQQQQQQRMAKEPRRLRVTLKRGVE